MHGRQGLIERLRRHVPFDPHEARMRDRILVFVEEHEDSFERALEAGHVTGSAWVVDRDRTHALLVHHAKLGKWLQPGGHCDGDADVLRVALREAAEETGLGSLKPVSPEIFDVDAHDIPARGAEPAHVHYDVRFILEADRSEPLRPSEESHGIQWVRLDDIHRLNPDQSVLRLAARTLPAPRPGTGARQAGQARSKTARLYRTGRTSRFPS